jgi:hypothetical protein
MSDAAVPVAGMGDAASPRISRCVSALVGGRLLGRLFLRGGPFGPGAAGGGGHGAEVVQRVGDAERCDGRCAASAPESRANLRLNLFG